MGVVYVVTNKVNGKKYVGMTTRDLEVRKKAHIQEMKRKSSFEFHCAMRKYGVENFEWEIVFESEDRYALLDKEVEFIRELDTYNNGYNMTIGGEFWTGVYGEAQNDYDITEEQAKEIIRLAHETKLQQREIALIVDVPLVTVSRIFQGKSWRYLYDKAPMYNRPATPKANPSSMTLNQAKWVVRLYSEADMSIREIYRKTKVSEENINQIILGEVWGEAYFIKPAIKRRLKQRLKGAYVTKRATLFLK